MPLNGIWVRYFIWKVLHSFLLWEFVIIVENFLTMVLWTYRVIIVKNCIFSRDSDLTTSIVRLLVSQSVSQLLWLQNLKTSLNHSLQHQECYNKGQEASWSVMKHHEASWSIMKRHEASALWSIIKRHEASWRVIKCHKAP